MNSGRVHVVAPDDELRRSVTFALEAYGYSVTEGLSLPCTAQEQFDCMVVDERVLISEGSDALCKTSRPVLLIAYKPGRWRNVGADGVIAMPLTGEAVIQAVEGAISVHAGHAK